MRTTHPYLTRFAHWLGAISIFVLGMSGLQIFQAFPSFSAKLPQAAELPVPSWLGLGGWLGGAIAWHFTFAWFFAAAVLLSLGDLARGGWKRIWLSRAEWRGIWPMARYYFLRGPKPEVTELYNPLQKFAYLSMTLVPVGALITGLLLAQPVQLGFAINLLGGWQMVRILHLACLCGFAAFIPGHLVMVALAGKPAIWSMLSGRSLAEVERNRGITVQ